MTYKVIRTRQAVRHLDLIFDHLADSYTALGETLDASVERAAKLPSYT